MRGWEELAQSLGAASAHGGLGRARARLSPRPFRMPPSSSRCSRTALRTHGLDVSAASAAGRGRRPVRRAIAALAYEATDHDRARREPISRAVPRPARSRAAAADALALRAAAPAAGGSPGRLDDAAVPARSSPSAGTRSRCSSRMPSTHRRALDAGPPPRARARRRDRAAAQPAARSSAGDRGARPRRPLQAGGAGLEIGGDWYDAVRRPDGILHLTVGDVAGRGIPAAMLMGQLRNAFRALRLRAHLARRDRPPADRATFRYDGMATAIFLTIDPYTGELAYASPGHPPSLLLDVDSGRRSRGSIRQNAPPLGWADAARRSGGAVDLPTHATLLAYTDGLVERRGVEHRRRHRPGWRSCSATARTCRPREAADRLLETSVPLSAHDDDIALLLVRSHRRAVADGDRDPRAIRRLMHDVRAASGRGSRGAGSARSNGPMRCSPSSRRATTRSSTATPGGAGRSSCCSSTAADAADVHDRGRGSLAPAAARPDPGPRHADHEGDDGSHDDRAQRVRHPGRARAEATRLEARCPPGARLDAALQNRPKRTPNTHQATRKRPSAWDRRCRGPGGPLEHHPPAQCAGGSPAAAETSRSKWNRERWTREASASPDAL